MIITNNPSVVEKYPEKVLFIDGSVEQILIKVRDLVYEGYDLISHPLPASLRIMFSPYRSILIGRNNGRLDPLQAQIVEDSIHKYKSHMDVRGADKVNSDDYKLMDLILLESALDDEKGKW